jgi:hypothetical protein
MEPEGSLTYSQALTGASWIQATLSQPIPLRYILKNFAIYS